MANHSMFDEATFDILYKGKIHDYTIEKLSIDTFWGADDKRLANIKMVLEYNNKRFLCQYISVEYFNLQKDFNIEQGFDAILVSECLIYQNYFEHILYFVGNELMTIKCQNIRIHEVS